MLRLLATLKAEFELLTSGDEAQRFNLAISYLACWVAAVVLFLALLDWSRGYYVFAKWVVTAASLFVAYRAVQSKRAVIVILFAGTAFLFNPVAPIHLQESYWEGINLVVGLLFLISPMLFLSTTVCADPDSGFKCVVLVKLQKLIHQPSFVEKLVGSVIVFSLIGAMLVGGNIILGSAHEWLHHDDQIKLDSMVDKLNTEQNGINWTEERLRFLKGQLGTLRSEVNTLKAMSSSNKKDPSLERRYHELFAFFNSKLEEYNVLYEEHSQRIAAYNKNVEEANSIREKIGGK